MLCFFCITSNIFAQNPIPFYKNYTAKDYKADARNWAIVEDKMGVKYVANTEGVLTYDGANWRLIKVKGDAARGLAIDEVGNIFVSTVNDFGILLEDKKGQKVYQSLGDVVKHPKKPITTIFNTFYLEGEGVFFQTHKVVYLYNHQTKKVKHWADDKAIYANFYKSGNDAFLKIENENEDSSFVFKYQKNDFKPILNKGNDEKDMMAVLEYSDQKHLFLTFKGLFLYHESNDSLSDFPSQANAWLTENRPYCGTIYQNPTTGERNFVLGSADGGIMAIDKSGNKVWEANQNNGLPCTDANDLFTDANNGIWLVNSCGVTHFPMELGLAFLNKTQNIKARVYDYLKHKGWEYACTNNGFLASNGNGFELVKTMEAQTWKILPFGEGVAVANGNHCFHYVVGNKIVSNDAFYSALMTIERSKMDSNFIYFGHYQGFRLAKFNGKTFDIVGEMKSMEKICRTVLETADGKLWIGVPNDGFYQITVPKEGWTKENFEKQNPVLLKEGIAELGWCKVFKIKNKILFTANSGVYEWNEKNKKFETYNPWGIDFKEKKYQASSLLEDAQGRVWFVGAKTIFTPKADGSWEKDEHSLAVLDQKILNVKAEDKNVFWLCGEEALVRFDNRVKPTKSDFQTIISKIIMGKDSIFLDGVLANLPQNTIFDYAHNSLRVHFTALSFVQEKENLFSYKLEGYDDNWSAWSKESFKEFTNLSEGNYVFSLRSKNILGQEGKTTTFTFTIKPPFYRTYFAYLLYALLFFGLIYLAVKLNSIRLLKAQKILEAIIQERTADILKKTVELEQQNEEIEAQAEGLREANNVISEQSTELSATLHKVEEQNKHITSGINYAKRIQEAMLPTNEKAKLLGNHFIFFRPRDIVSGDFYWVEKPNDDILLFAAADCTGHGVPGAFMSLIGIQMLKEIVQTKGIYGPNLILAELHLGIRAALKQKESSNRDGMDIALCAYSSNEKILTYAGAHNPLVYVCEGNLETVKADNLGIGGEQREIERIFTLHTIKIESPTWIYIYSDGFQDQFGGNEGRKFMSKNFKQLLLNISSHSGAAQHLLLQESFENWLIKGKHKQIDDVLVMGILLD